MNVILAQAISWFSQIIVVLVLAHVILSYFMSPYHPIRSFVDRMVEPLLAPIRRVVPFGGDVRFQSNHFDNSGTINCKSSYIPAVPVMR